MLRNSLKLTLTKRYKITFQNITKDENGSQPKNESDAQYADNIFYFRSLLGFLVISDSANFKFLLNFEPDLFEKVSLTRFSKAYTRA